MALTPAERQRRRRERVSAGKRRLVLWLDEGVVDDVLRLAGLLDCDDANKLNAAFGRVVERLARQQVEAALARRMSHVTMGHKKL